jgi:hypothetical protein
LQQPSTKEMIKIKSLLKKNALLFFGDTGYFSNFAALTGKQQQQNKTL